MKNIILILLIFTLTSCGYSTVYNKNNTTKNLNIVVQNMEGDRSINNLVHRKLKKYSTDKTDEMYIIDLDSSLSKSTISKDKTGKATNINLSVNINFDVRFDEKNENFSFRENINIENSSDLYEQNKYENEIKNNFADSIIEKLILKLSQIK